MSSPKTATEMLKVLWSEKYFVEWRKYSAVVDELSKRHYHFSDPELGMALKRASHLTRKGKRMQFEYIQKYPYTEEKSNGP